MQAVLPAVGLLVVGGCGHAATRTAQRADLVPSDASIHYGAGNTIRNGTIVVSGNRITYVGPTMPQDLPAGTRRVDLHGKFVIPGLVDAHVHFGQTGFFEARSVEKLGAPQELPQNNSIPAHFRASKR